MKLIAVGAALVAAWLAGLLLYVNYFSETERDGGGLVKAAAWASLALGLVLIAAGVVASMRRVDRT